jgi:hypothetical protein
MACLPRILPASLAFWAAFGWAAPAVQADEPAWLSTGVFSWKATGPLVSPARRESDPCHAIKDPTIVRHDGRWHLFATIRSQKRTHQIEYLSFADWPEADRAKRHVLSICDGYFCAPQVFWFEPHNKWYLLFQTSDAAKHGLVPAVSTTDTIADPKSWSAPTLLFGERPQGVPRWIDFWVICDDVHAHLFFTSLDGQMWRSQTPLADFPRGWSEPEVALKGDIFEASHTYKLQGRQQYLTLVESQGAGGRRYFKAYLADRLTGPWKELAATEDKPFAAAGNVEQPSRQWTDSFSHGELLRAGRDQRLEVDPAALQFLFQGVSDKGRSGKAYGAIPWQLGLLQMK